MDNKDKLIQKNNLISERQAYEQLQYYTLNHGGFEFVHQHIVDAWAAQIADEQTKPITLAFALVGLYLHVEKGFTGRQVQMAHMKLAQRKRVWPLFILPNQRGAVTASQVLATSAGPERDKAISVWCESVWDAYSNSHQVVAELLQEFDII